MGSRRRAAQPLHHYPRTARVNEVVLETLADELGHLADPRLGFVTLTGVEVAPDLRSANVFYSVLGTPAERETSAEALQSASSHLRSTLGRHVRLKNIPELRFRPDPAITEGARVDEIIRRLHSQATER